MYSTLLSVTQTHKGLAQDHQIPETQLSKLVSIHSRQRCRNTYKHYHLDDLEVTIKFRT